MFETVKHNKLRPLFLSRSPVAWLLFTAIRRAQWFFGLAFGRRLGFPVLMCHSQTVFIASSPNTLLIFQSKLQETPVFVPPPPPTQHYDPMAPLPRLARLEKSFPEQEFGFNLHAEREKGHFIGIVDENGIGQKAGLEMGQRIVGVNGKLIYPNTGHKEVVSLIKKSPMSTTLLVVSEETDKWHRDHGVAYSFDHYEQPPTHPIEVETHHHHEEVHATPAKTNGYEVTPALNPHVSWKVYVTPLELFLLSLNNPNPCHFQSIQVNEEREISKLTTTTKTEVISTNTASYQYKVFDKENADEQPVVITTCSFLNVSDPLISAGSPSSSELCFFESVLFSFPVRLSDHLPHTQTQITFRFAFFIFSKLLLTHRKPRRPTTRTPCPQPRHPTI